MEGVRLGFGLVVRHNQVCKGLSERMDDMRSYVLFSNISVILGRRNGDNERLRAIASLLRLER